MLQTKYQPNIPGHSGEKNAYIGFAIFSIGGHLEFSIIMNFIILKFWSLIMLHVNFENHGCSSFREWAI